MRILSIAGIKDFLTHNKPLSTKALMKPLIHIVCNRGIILSGMLESLDHELTAKLKCILIIFQSLYHFVIIFWIGDDDDALKVFSSTSYHCRPANIDIFYDLFKIISALYRLFKWVEINTNQINWLDSKLFRLFYMIWLVSAKKNTSMHIRIERLYPTLKTLWKVSNFANFSHFQSCIFKHPPCSSSTYNLIAQIYQTFSKIHNTCFVTHTQQCTHRFPLNFLQIISYLL